MEFIRGAYNLRPHHQGCVATIGNFDGVHLGHQAIIQQLLVKGAALGLPSVVIVFEPQPREYFSEGEMFAGVTLGPTPPRLMITREKIEAIAALGVDKVLCLKFNKQMCALTAQRFLQSILVDGLAIQHLVVGDDFHFGNDRCGDFAFLQKKGKEHGFSVENTCTYEVDGERVSSTRIRQALATGSFDSISALLGRTYSISGRVTYGDQLGRTIGVPTANVPLKRRVTPLTGVFAVEVNIEASGGLPADRRQGVANVGSRPTVSGTEMRLETHLFDFNDSLYGRRIDVVFKHKIRKEQKFDGLDALKAQIAQDIITAKTLFSQSN